MGTSDYCGRAGRVRQEEIESSRLLDGCERLVSGLAGFGDGDTFCAGAVDIADDVEIAVELDAGAERSGGFVAAAPGEQAGELQEAEILEVHNVALRGRVWCGRVLFECILGRRALFD